MSAAKRLHSGAAGPAPLLRDPAQPAAQLPLESAVAATLAWLGHVEAGRIGGPAAPPAAGELRLTSLAAILGPRRVRIW